MIQGLMGRNGLVSSFGIVGLRAHHAPRIAATSVLASKNSYEETFIEKLCGNEVYNTSLLRDFLNIASKNHAL